MYLKQTLSVIYINNKRVNANLSYMHLFFFLVNRRYKWHETLKPLTRWAEFLEEQLYAASIVYA